LLFPSASPLASRGDSAIVAIRGTGNGTPTTALILTLTTLQNEIVEFLHLGDDPGKSAARCGGGEPSANGGSSGRTFRRFDSPFVPLTPPAEMKDLH